MDEILDLALNAFLDGEKPELVEPLEQVIDGLKETLRTNHIRRLQQGSCTIDVGFVWNDLLTNLERTSDHCSNIAGCVIDQKNRDMNMHENLRALRRAGENFRENLTAYAKKYAIH